MLDKWLDDPPATAEKIAALRPPKETSSVGEKVDATREYIEEWQASWERKR
jgi:hypothetical protein